MSERQEEYNYAGKEEARQKTLLERIVATLAAEPEQFVDLLSQDQARAIVRAITAKYPELDKSN